MALHHISFTFNEISKSTFCPRYSPNYIFGPTKWFLGLRVKKLFGKDVMEISLYGMPTCGYSEDTIFEYNIDIKTSIKTHSCLENNYCKEETNVFIGRSLPGKELTGNCVYFQSFSDVLAPDFHLIEDDKMMIEIQMDIKNVDGSQHHIRHNFKDPELPDADLMLDVYGAKLYCHSLILSLHSPFFKEEILREKMKKVLKVEPSAEPSIKRKRSLDSGIDELNKSKMTIFLSATNLELNIVELFLQMLYTHEKRIVNRFNVEKFLKFAATYKIQILFNHCEDFLMKDDGKLFSKERTAVLAWRYNLETLKLYL